MQILHVSSESTWRGGEQQIAYLIYELQEKGICNEVLCRKNSSFEEHCSSNNIHFVSKPFSGLNILSTAYFVSRYGNKFDVIHAHTAKSHLILFIALLLGLKTPVVVSRRVDFKPSSSWLTKWRYAHKGVKKIICVSDAIKNIMKGYLQKDEEKCVTIYSGIDIQKFDVPVRTDIRKALKIASSQKIVANTSALADHKDYFTFLDTAKQVLLTNPEVHFLIIGDGPLNEEIRSYATKLHLNDQVSFTGFVNNVPEMLKQVDVFFISSKTEGLGTSILDAFAAGVPVVATNAGGISEIVINKKTGLLAEVKDVKGLAQHIERLLSSEVLQHTLVLNAKKHLQKFTKETTAQKTLAVYKEIVI